ncbi:diguanylate cyclase [Lacticaseibacillus rhamnosus]
MGVLRTSLGQPPDQEIGNKVRGQEQKPEATDRSRHALSPRTRYLGSYTIFSSGFVLLANARRHEQVLAQASADSLTGLLNHRAFQVRLEEELARAHHQGQPLSVMMIDLDNRPTAKALGSSLTP